jgi:single-stranded-DNA-specific exonuclease
LILDAEVPLAALSVKLVRELNQLEPYGAENKKPLYMASDLQIAREPSLVGEDGQHLRFQVSQGGVNLWAIAFRMGKRKDELMSQAGKCSIAFTPSINSWNGSDSVQLEIHDFQAGDKPLLI